MPFGFIITLIILLQIFNELKLCEIIIIVLPFLNFSKKLIISSSVFLSKELVGSSKIINSGSLYNALANPNLCFSPID